MNVIVFVVDRLNAGFLGPYGNTWVETPALNRLASEGWLAEFMQAASLELSGAYRGYWRGREPLEPSRADREPLSLPERWSAAGRQTCLITDDEEVAALADADLFEQQIVLPAEEEAAAPANDLEAMQFARIVAAAAECCARVRAPFALWVHARGLAGPWDAPPELRERLRDEDDPPAWQGIAPPEANFGPDSDPDDILGFVQAYAAQVSAMDECLGALLEEGRESAWGREAMVVVTSPRGYLLGQQGFVGQRRHALLSDALHVPLIVRWPGERWAARRGGGLFAPSSLYALLSAPASEPPAPRSWVVAQSATEQSLRTVAWQLRVTPTGSELYAKPDDRHDAVDVASRCQREMDALTQALAERTAALQADTAAALPPLEELLVAPH